VGSRSGAPNFPVGLRLDLRIEMASLNGLESRSQSTWAIIMSLSKNATLSIAIVAVFSGCSRWNFGSSWSSDTPLLTDFRKICVETKMRPKAVDAAAELTEATLDDQIGDKPDNTLAHKIWTHSVGGHSVGITVGQFPWRGGDRKILDVCAVEDMEDQRKSIKGLEIWLGKPLREPIPIAEFTLEDGFPHELKRSDVREEQVALSSGTLYDLYVVVEPNLTSLLLRMWGKE